MSDMLESAVQALKDKLGGADLGATVKFSIDGVGSVVVDGATTPPTIAAGEGDADVTISAADDVFRDLMAGDTDPTAAYMTGRLRIDGDMGLAMKLAQMLA